MPPAKKRKTAAAARAAKAAKAAEVEEAARAVAEDAAQPAAAAEYPSPQPVEMDKSAVDVPTATDRISEPDAPAEASAPAPPSSASGPEAAPTTEDAAAKASKRMARFRALQQRAKMSSDSNIKAATAEAQRLGAPDAGQLATLRRQHAVASQKLLKAETEDAGGDFERKRAWDWTAEESERWDKRMRKKEAARDNNAFQDYRAESQKVYKRQLKNMTPDMERYARDKMAAIEKAAAKGSLEIVETDDGELVAVDKDGTFYATADSTSFADNKPTKEAIDRLVGNQKKADDVAARKRKERMAKNGDEGDVTYINEKNKQFNQKLARFYDKYTAEIRDSFERGTMI